MCEKSAVLFYSFLFIEVTNLSSLLGYTVHISGRDGKGQLNKRISRGGADERSKMAKKCGPLHSLLHRTAVVVRASVGPAV